ncbi:MAG: HugZ family protein [Opitutales bacterium]
MTTSTAPEQTDIFAEALGYYEALLGGFQSIILGTVSAEGRPEASYAPAIVDEKRNFYVYVSALAAHTANLEASHQASVLVIEDEAGARQLFARQRATFDCEAELIERHNTEWELRLDAMEEKFGSLIKHLRTLEDFSLFRLKPRSGRLVTGFARAFQITGERFDELDHRRGIDGKGHVSEKKSTN